MSGPRLADLFSPGNLHERAQPREHANLARLPTSTPPPSLFKNKTNCPIDGQQPMTMPQSVGNTPTHSRENSTSSYSYAPKRAKLPVLARICDDIRASIQGHRGPGPWPHLTELSGLVSAFLQDEEVPSMHVNLETIKACRLDKLLADILNPKHHPRRASEELLDLVAKAGQLQGKWAARFGEDFTSIDDVRSLELKQTGYLKDLYLSVEDGNPSWRIREGRAPSVEVVTNTSLELGQ